MGVKIRHMVRESEKGLSFVAGLCVVPINKNTNTHDYPMGQPSLVQDGRSERAIRPNGKIGNNLPTWRDGIRPATNKEIDKLFAGDYSE